MNRTGRKLLLAWIGSSTTSTWHTARLWDGSLEKHDQYLWVCLNCGINVRLLLLQILHEHRSKFLISQKPLTDCWEARIRYKRSQLLGNLGSDTSGRITSTSDIGTCIRIRLLISIVSKSSGASHGGEFFFAR